MKLGQDKSHFDLMVKVLIIGNSAVGKSSIINKFCDATFTHNHIATIGIVDLFQANLFFFIGIDFKINTIEVEGKKVKMQIWDTAGQEKFRSIVNTFYKGAMAIMIAYACDDEKSFHDVESWIEQIEENAPPDIIKVLIANKSDLDVDDIKISYEQGKSLADKYGIGFFETSAKLGKNVYESFHEIARQIKQKVGESDQRDRVITGMPKGTKLENGQEIQNGTKSKCNC